MSGNMTIATAVERIARLTPTYRSPTLKGEGAYVLTSPNELPEQFREAQRERTEHYRFSADPLTARTKPDHAPQYVVTSYGVVIAWVTLDGRTHFADLDAILDALPGDAPGPRLRTIQRHQQAVRAVWPERFGLDADGDATPRVPGGFRRDDDGNLHPLV